MFILDRIDRELHSLERLELKFGLSSEFFNKVLVRILLDVLFRVFRFSRASFYALASSFMRVVKGIFVNRELLVLFPVNCEITFLFLVKRDFGNRREP